MNQTTLAKLAASFQEADNGIDYHPKYGAVCPWCGERLIVQDTRPWSKRSRIRYQKCVNSKCPLSTMDKTVKTVQKI